MRVISGSARGLKLNAPKGLATRPTTDRIKESLFNMIAFDLYGCRFLDLFSGSGGIGIEALSRGASKAVLVDHAQESIKAITLNLEKARLAEKAEVLCMKVNDAIAMLGARNEIFDIIFMDPPYDKGFTDSTLYSILNAHILAPDALIIAEQSQQEDIPHAQELEVVRIKDYKITKMTFLKLKKSSLEDF